MAVYLIRAGENGPVKIGYADDVESRMRELQCGNHETLRIIRSFEGGQTQEAELHVRFSDLRIRGEWFSYTRAMLGDLGLVEIFPKVLATKPTNRSMKLADYLKVNKISRKAFGEAVGVHAISVTRYTTGDRRPERDVMEKIIAQTGGQVQPNDFFASRENAPANDQVAP